MPDRVPSERRRIRRAHRRRQRLNPQVNAGRNSKIVDAQRAPKARIRRHVQQFQRVIEEVLLADHRNLGPQRLRPAREVADQEPEEQLRCRLPRNVRNHTARRVDGRSHGLVRRRQPADTQDELTGWIDEDRRQQHDDRIVARIVQMQVGRPLRTESSRTRERHRKEHRFEKCRGRCPVLRDVIERRRRVQHRAAAVFDCDVHGRGIVRRRGDDDVIEVGNTHYAGGIAANLHCIRIANDRRWTGCAMNQVLACDRLPRERGIWHDLERRRGVLHDESPLGEGDENHRSSRDDVVDAGRQDAQIDRQIDRSSPRLHGTVRQRDGDRGPDGDRRVAPREIADDVRRHRRAGRRIRRIESNRRAG